MLRITDQNWQDVTTQQFGLLPRPSQLCYGSPGMLARGVLPSGEYPDLLVPEDEWKERINEANEQRMFPIHHFEASKVPPKDQGNTNYCWAYGVTSAVEAVRLLENQPYRRLAPASLGWLVNWRNAGYYCSEAMRGISERGVCSSEFAGDGTTNPRTFEDGWEEDAPNYRLSEAFDTVGNGRTEKEQVRQCVSLLLSPLPLYIAYNWWGHALAMLGLIWDERYKHNLIWVGWNSHRDGRIELTGSRGVPDEAYAPRSSTFHP